METFKREKVADPLSKIKAAVRDITAYTLPAYRASVKLNQNENPFDIHDEIKAEVLRRLQTRAWSRYPDFVPQDLLESLARFAGWRADGTLAGNGSNELIQAILTVSVGPHTKVLLCEPTFTLYRQVVTILGGEVLSVPLRPDFQFDIEAIKRTIASQRCDLLLFCSPNNPTGSVIEGNHLREIAGNFDGLVIVDEAYHEFSGQSVVPLLNELNNLIVLRTFSKAMSMAGLRVGYLMTSPDLRREIHKATLPYNLNFFSSMAAQVACERFDLLEPAIRAIVTERQRLVEDLTAIQGVQIVPSRANFMLMRGPLPPGQLFKAFHERDILIRDVSKYQMLSDYVRISVGTPEENDLLIAGIREIKG